MNLLAAIVTHDRLDYSKATIESWIATARSWDHLVVFDNASTDGTQDYLRELGDDITVILSDRNLFPGAATNRAWHEGLKIGEYDLLMRSDNDIRYAHGWRDEVEACFDAFPKLMQLGVLNKHEDYDDEQPVTELRKNNQSINVEWDQVGGNCVIRRSVWDDGARWQAGAWRPGGLDGGFDEDTVMSMLINETYGMVATVIPTIAHNMSFHRYEDYPDYYNVTAKLRGLVPELSV